MALARRPRRAGRARARPARPPPGGAAPPRRLGPHPVRPRDADCPSGASALAHDDGVHRRALPAPRHTTGLAPRPLRAPGHELGSCAAHHPARPASGRRRRRPAHDVGAQRARRSAPDAVRHPDPLHDRGRRAGRDLRRHAVLRARRGGRDARPRPAPRVGGADARGERPALPAHRRHPPRPARHRERPRARVGQGARRVRRDDHLRGQLPGPDADPSPARLRRAERDPQVAISISIMLLAVSVLVLGALRGRWLR